MPPRNKRLKNIEVRPREWLTKVEIDRMIATALKHGRHQLRNATMILFGFQHGLRSSELVNFLHPQLDFNENLVHIIRLKNSKNSYHPFWNNEREAIIELKRLYPSSVYVFPSERNGKIQPMTIWNFWKIIERIAKLAKINIKVHPHMLRHSTSNYLQNEKRNKKDIREVQEFLGHVDIKNTERYSHVPAGRFQDFF